MKYSLKLWSGTLALVIVVVATAASASASAYQGDPTIQGPNHSPEREIEMTQAFETNNYAAWKDLMNGKGRVVQVINADNFSQFAEAHKLAQEGKIEEAKAIRTKLGLGLRNGNRKGHRKAGTGNCTLNN